MDPISGKGGWLVLDFVAAMVSISALLHFDDDGAIEFILGYSICPLIRTLFN